MHASYKFYLDPRGVGQPKEPIYKFRDTPIEPQASSKAAFCFRKLAKTGILLGLQTWIIGPAIAASFDFRASDFEPKHEVFSFVIDLGCDSTRNPDPSFDGHQLDLGGTLDARNVPLHLRRLFRWDLTTGHRRDMASTVW
jgi:hypothetical protein